MQVFPVSGRLVRDPVTGQELSAEGMTVSDKDPFWLRRLADGDVTNKTSKTKEASKQ